MPSIHLLSSFRAHEGIAWYVSWSPDGNQLLTCSSDRSVKLWGRMGDTWSVIETMDGIHKKSIRSCEMSPDGNYIAAASFDSNISVYRKNNEEWVFFTMLEGHVNEVKNICWSYDGQLLASTSRDRNIIVWGMNQEEEEMDCVSVLSGHIQDVKFARFNPANNNLYSCSYDDTVKVWLYDGEDYSNINTLRAHEGTVWGIAFKQRERPEVGNPDSMEEEIDQPEHIKHEVVSGIGLNDDDDGMDELEVPDDTQIVSEFITCGMNGKVIFWKEIQDNIGNSSETHKFLLNGGDEADPFYSIDWNENGVLVAGGDNDTHLFTEVSDGEFIDELHIKLHDCDINCIRWNPVFKNQFATCDDDGLVKVWEVAFYSLCYINLFFPEFGNILGFFS